VPTADALLEAWRIRLRETMVQRLKPWLTAGLQLGPLEDKLLRALWSRGPRHCPRADRGFRRRRCLHNHRDDSRPPLQERLASAIAPGSGISLRPKTERSRVESENRRRGIKETTQLRRATPSATLFLVEAISQHKNHAALLEQLEQAIARKRRDLRSIRAPAVARVKPKKNVRRVVKRRTRRAA